MVPGLHLFVDHELMDMEVVATCDVAVPTTVYGRAGPTTATESVRPMEWVAAGTSLKLGGQARVIRMPMGLAE
jgi:hypothetical protein